MIDWLLDGAVDWLARQIQAMLAGLVAFLTDAFFTSPDVTVFPQVRALAGRAALVVDTAFVLAIIAAGAIAMSHGTLQLRYQAKDLLPRLVVGFALSHVGTQLCQLIITTANALTVAMVGQPATGPQVVEFVRARIVGALTSPAQAFLAVIIGLIIVGLLYTLLAGWFVRIVTLIVLAGVAPLALACHCLPQLQAAAALWWRSLLGCLAVPLAQAILFSVGVELILNPDHNVIILLGVPAGASTDVFNLFIIACLLWMAARVPKLVARYLARPGGMSSAGVMLRALVIQTVTRRLPMRGR